MKPAHSALAHVIRVLRKNGIALSDRRAVKVQRLVAAAAVMGGRLAPTEADVWPIVRAVPTREAQTAARDVLRDVLAQTENLGLSAAAAEATANAMGRGQPHQLRRIRELAQRTALGGARTARCSSADTWTVAGGSCS
jgi:MoxR-like ATPase